MEAIEALRNAAEPNPWRGADDEAVAGAIREAYKTRRAQTMTPNPAHDGQR